MRVFSGVLSPSGGTRRVADLKTQNPSAADTVHQQNVAKRPVLGANSLNDTTSSLFKIGLPITYRGAAQRRVRLMQFCLRQCSGM
jgi:hypothetical protein